MNTLKIRVMQMSAEVEGDRNWMNVWNLASSGRCLASTAWQILK